MSWKQTTWYVFHMFSLHYQPAYRDKYITFFHSFKFILPCEVCLHHYQYHLKREKYTLQENINEKDIFAWTVQIHNLVSSSIQKKTWAMDEAKMHYHKLKLDSNLVKVMILEYVKHNFKKGSQKTEELIKMLDSMRYIYPIPEKREKLMQMKLKLDRKNIKDWLLEFLYIICNE
jgi:hypothetical protein